MRKQVLLSLKKWDVVVVVVVAGASWPNKVKTRNSRLFGLVWLALACWLAGWHFFRRWAKRIKKL